MTREEAIEWMQEEKASFERAPDLNGCPMTEYWQKAIDVYDMAISAIRRQDVTDTNVGKNEPLTLDELRQMDGEPVWVVCLKPERYYEPPIGWRIIEKSIVGTFGVWNDSSCLAERDYGKTWLAYRQKPEEDHKRGGQA